MLLEDKTINAGPGVWGEVVAKLYKKYNAVTQTTVVVESNFGGQMCVDVIKKADPNVWCQKVVAQKSKGIRALSIVGLYEQERVWHASDMVELEDQMKHMTASGYQGDGSPDRLDAAVHALRHLVADNASYTIR